MSEQMTCGKCFMPIHQSETGLRHFGNFTAHSENRCIQILTAELTRVTEQLQGAREEIERLKAAVDHDVISDVNHFNPDSLG